MSPRVDTRFLARAQANTVFSRSKAAERISGSDTLRNGPRRRLGTTSAEWNAVPCPWEDSDACSSDFRSRGGDPSGFCRPDRRPRRTTPRVGVRWFAPGSQRTPQLTQSGTFRPPGPCRPSRAQPDAVVPPVAGGPAQSEPIADGAAGAFVPAEPRAGYVVAPAGAAVGARAPFGSGPAERVEPRAAPIRRARRSQQSLRCAPDARA